jgi:hypothetical protein
MCRALAEKSGAGSYHSSCWLTALIVDHRQVPLDHTRAI